MPVLFDKSDHKTRPSSEACIAFLTSHMTVMMMIVVVAQHCHDDEVIGLRIDACLDHGDPSSWSNFLGSSGLVERETLNHVARYQA